MVLALLSSSRLLVLAALSSAFAACSSGADVRGDGARSSTEVVSDSRTM